MSEAALKSDRQSYLHRPASRASRSSTGSSAQSSKQRFDVPDQPMQGRDGPLLLPDQAQELHSARISVPHAIRRRPSRQAATTVRATFEAVRRWLPFGFAARRSLRLLVPPDDAWHLGRAPSSLPKRPARPRCGSAPAAARSCSSTARRSAGWRHYVPQPRSQAGIRGGAAAGRERDPHLVRRSGRARRALFLPARLCRRPGGTSSAVADRLRAAIADAVEAALDGMHFDRRPTIGGDVALVTAAPLPVDSDVSMSRSKATSCRRKARRLRLRAASLAQTRLVIGPTENCRPISAISEVDARRRRLRRIARLRRRDLPRRTPGRRAGHALPRASPKRSTKSPNMPKRDTVRAFARLAIGPRRRRNRRDDRGDAAGDRGLPRLRRLHRSCRCSGARSVLADQTSAPELRDAHRPRHPGLPLLDG